MHHGISWRPLAADDLPMLAAWLSEPRVARWWNHEVTPEAIERDWGPSVRGEEPGDDFVVMVDGAPVGLVQRSRFGDYPDDLHELSSLTDVPPEAVELDYMIGVSELQGRGLGPRLIAFAVERTWDEMPDVPAVIVPVVAANRASWRALEKAGFRRVAEGPLEPDNPIDDPAHVVYRLDRPSAGRRV